MALVWSYSFWSTFNNCPRQAQHKYVLKDVPYVETEAQKWGNTVHSALENRLRSKTPLPPECAAFENFATAVEAMPGIREVEIKVGVNANWNSCGFFAPEVVGRGKIDVVLMTETCGFILDWKTGKVKEDPLELEISAALMKAIYPVQQVWKGAYVWLKEGRIGQAHALDPQKAREKIARDMSGVNFLLGKPDPWPVRPSGLCHGYCPVKSCSHYKGS